MGTMADNDRKLRRRAKALSERARELDSRPKLLDAAARLRAALPGDDQYGDTLSLAGRRPDQLVGKGLSALQPRRSSVVHELGLTALQLWQAASEAQGRGRGEKDLALLFTDLVGFSSWALEAGDEAAVELLRAVANVTEPAIREHSGRIVKHLGDGWMAVFPTAGGAVEAAFEILRELRDVEVAGHRPQLRAGVHWGRPRAVGGDYLGVDVNITARVADAAKGGEVLVSGYALARLDGVAVESGRSRRLKAAGAPDDLRISSVAPA